MFTGLIETVGHVIDVTELGTVRRLRVRTPMAAELAPGESVSVNGVCLTVTHAAGDEMFADVGPETLRVTTLGAVERDQPVNLERAMRADSRFGGHFVQGHVDGVGTVDDVRTEADARWLTIVFPEALAAYFVRKGSITVDGVSLTVAGLGDDRFDVMIIPFTWAHTSLPSLRVGSRVNLECDVVGKYVARAAELYQGRLKPDTVT
jgi:riboflavin synthase